MSMNGSTHASADAPTGPYVTAAQRFAIMPEALLYDPAISSDAVRVYGVLLRHGSDPANCYPSHARIARLIGRAKSSVPAWIRELVTAGWVEIVPRTNPDGSNAANGYVVNAVRVERAHPADEQGGVPADEQGGTLLHSAHKESKGTRAIETNLVAPPAGDDGAQLALITSPPSAPPAPQPTQLSRSMDQEFAQAWALYPRKIARGAALKAYRARRRAGVPEAELLAAVRNYAQACRGKQTEFVMHGATFFGANERWRDYTELPAPAAAAPAVVNVAPAMGLPNGGRRTMSEQDVARMREQVQQQLAAADAQQGTVQGIPR